MRKRNLLKSSVTIGYIYREGEKKGIWPPSFHTQKLIEEGHRPNIKPCWNKFVGPRQSCSCRGTTSVAWDLGNFPVPVNKWSAWTKYTANPTNGFPDTKPIWALYLFPCSFSSQTMRLRGLNYVDYVVPTNQFFSSLFFTLYPVQVFCLLPQRRRSSSRSVEVCLYH